MEIREALDAMRVEGNALKGRLRAMIDAELQAFTAKTGLSVDAVEMGFVECTPYGSAHRVYVLGELNLQIATD